MRKTIFTILFLFILLNVSAQTELPIKYEAGITVGFNTPKFLNDHIIDFLVPKDFRIRLVLGSYIRHYPTKHFYLEYGMSLSGEGGGYNNRKTNLNYLKNQLSFGYTVMPYRKNIFYFGVTYNANMLLNAKSKDDLNHTSENIKKYFRQFYQGVGVAVGLKKRINQTDYIRFNLSTQLYSSNINTAEFHKSRQLLFPSLQLGYSRILK
jgi:hypothetical protein